jgi:hypothetical protein
MKRLVAAILLLVGACSSSSEPGPTPSPVAAVVLTLTTVGVVPGGALLLNVDLLDSVGTALPGEHPNWESTDTSVVRVDTGGTITGRSAGLADIMASSNGHADTTVVHVDTVTFTQISTGGDHVCALTAAGKAYCWGSGYFGGLGYGDTLEAVAPVAVAGGLTFSKIAAGLSFTCALTLNLHPYCWGRNDFGQLGIGTLDVAPHPGPLPVVSSPSFAVINDANTYTTCGVSVSGAAWCWGYNGSLQVGDSAGGMRVASPFQVAGGHVFSDVNIGGINTCGLDTGGEILCWGEYQGAKITDPTMRGDSVTYTRLAAGGGHICGILASGKTMCWGYNRYGELGATSFSDHSDTALVVTDGHIFGDITAGGYHTCAISAADHAGWCWGLNADGQLGDGTGVTGDIGVGKPIAVAGNLTWSELSAGNATTCGITIAGVAYCWGSNTGGELGFGHKWGDTFVMSLVPVQVLGQR